LINGFWLYNEEALEDVGEMSDVELVVEVGGGFPKVALDLGVETELVLHTI